ncbi:unnamed protein product [Wuchereria bancrofti]|uniref:Uncharacterized protein n=1 Tax=Wuchereria bancrofti TaxID=6293 RepID=A0A3P7DXF2_WUCBA|nr:unnamed protein product [Wuchereria bancrofti]
MKRHLSTCHGLQDDDLKDGCIDKMKYKEVIESRLENGSRNKRSKNLQHFKVTPKLSQMVSDNTPSSSTVTDCNTMKMISEVAIADEALSTFPTISSSFSNCKQEQFALSLINSSVDNIALEAGKDGSLSEMTEMSSNDNTNQFMRLNTIDETIEAVIANGNENSINKMGKNNSNNNNNDNNSNSRNNNKSNTNSNNNDSNDNNISNKNNYNIITDNNTDNVNNNSNSYDDHNNNSNIIT